MRIAEYEKAIDALGCGIEIDEMATSNGGDVRACYAHKGNELLMWDEGGRAFGCVIAGEVDCETHVNVPMEMYSRAQDFDLEFD